MLSDSQSSSYKDAYRYLPLLSLLLVLVSLGLLVKMYLSQPSTQRERRIAAFARALEEIPRRYVDRTSPDQLYNAAMRGMVGSLSDPYSAYLSRYELENAAVQTEGEFGGVGVMVSPRNGGAVIIDTQEGGPAKAAGVKPGDVIVAVDGRPAGDMPFVQLVSTIRGKVGTKVELTLERAESGDRETVEIERHRIELDSVVWRRLEGDIGYVTIRQFDSQSLSGMRKAVDELTAETPLAGLLIDVRGNNGGLLDQAVGIADMFLSSGNIVRLRSRLPAERKSFNASENVAIEREVPIVVLVDHRSASASEVLAGALQSSGRSTVIGTETFGKGAVNRIMPLPDGSGVLLTVAEYTVGGGKKIEGVGVQPEIVVGEVGSIEPGLSPRARREWLENYRAAQEKQYERALEFLRQKISPAGEGDR